MSSSPLQRYQRDLQQEGFIADPAQRLAVEKLQGVYEQLIAVGEVKTGLLDRLRGRQRHPVPVKGLYFWGGVGRGKTYLMDNFYESLPFDQKMRVHFHRFMRRVHRDLTQHSGVKNPLEKVAAGIAKDARVICFDEFFVSDITDAMILGGLMELLFAQGVTLIATSNIVPDKLYTNGLQRQRFLPAIALVKQHCEVVNVDSGTDYRLRALEQAELYHSPLDEQAEVSLHSTFDSLVPARDEVREDVALEVEGRDITCRFVGEDVVWFDFMALCDGPRSQNDYIELAREFHAVLISDMPQLGRDREDQARRFISLIDEFYDRNVKLAMSAAVPLEHIYSGGNLDFEFQRTLSRMLEMQSHDYLAQPHRP
ncbi:cell division protein ZapE [Gammaproteobacteria bacterium 53_120_T64]|nr:cell division protein ZapE [Gammaproteobacteria bacterium 53_120_T64]